VLLTLLLNLTLAAARQESSTLFIKAKPPAANDPSES